jgi:membrane-associated phospholipid phosphatase
MGAGDEARTAAPRDFGVMRQLGSNLRAFFTLLFRSPRPIQFRPAGLAPTRVLIAATASLAAVAAAILLLDVPATTAVRQLPLWLIAAFDTLTDLGKSGWLLFPIGLLLLGLAAIAGRSLPRLNRLVVISFALRLTFVFAAIALPGLFVTIIKRLIGRARPFVEPDGGSFFLAPFGWSADYASIPSGHGTTAFAAAIAVGAVWPRARAFMWLYAFLVAASRVVVTAHYPSDLLASAFFGILGALLVRHSFAVRRLGFVVDRSGAVRALPGPSLRRLKSVAHKLLAQ